MWFISCASCFLLGVPEDQKKKTGELENKNHGN